MSSTVSGHRQATARKSRISPAIAATTGLSRSGNPVRSTSSWRALTRRLVVRPAHRGRLLVRAHA